MIEVKINYIINTLSNTKKDLSHIFYFRDNDIKKYNAIISKMNGDDYLNVLDTILNNFSISLEKQNHKESKKWIIIYFDFFYLYKDRNISVYNEINNKFLSLCRKYDDLFLRSENKNFLNNIEDKIHKFINKEINIYKLKKYESKFLDTDLKYLFEIFTFKFLNNNDHFNDFDVIKIIKEIMVDSYITIRKYHNVDMIYSELDRLVDYFLNNQLNNLLYYRILSLISLKNDIKLQEKLDSKQLDKYLSETKIFLNPVLTCGSDESLYKVSQNLMKIQFGYNLLKIDKSIRKEYDDIFKKIVDFYHYKNIIINKKSAIKNLKQFHSNVDAYILFIGDLSDKKAYRKLTLFLNDYKYRHYGVVLGTLKKLKDYIFYKKYNFIY